MLMFFLSIVNATIELFLFLVVVEPQPQCMCGRHPGGGSTGRGGRRGRSSHGGRCYNSGARRWRHRFLSRCGAFLETGFEMRRRPLLFLFLAAQLLLPAQAFERPFPPGAKRGTMSSAPHPDIVIGGEPRRLAPGARIWNADNLIEMPAALDVSNVPVNYTEDPEGAIDRVWILTGEEARQSIRQQTNSGLR